MDAYKCLEYFEKATAPQEQRHCGSNAWTKRSEKAMNQLKKEEKIRLPNACYWKSRSNRSKLPRCRQGLCPKLDMSLLLTTVQRTLQGIRQIVVKVKTICLAVPRLTYM